MSFFSWRRKGTPNPSNPQVPDGIRIYAIGDIHGRIDLLDHLLELIQKDKKDQSNVATIGVFLGDYVDRGQASNEVLERLSRGHPGFDRSIYLRGNHEAVMLEFLQDPLAMESWGQIGGFETLFAYGIAPPLVGSEAAYSATRAEFAESVPRHHRSFLDSLEYTVVIGDYFFVHAGVRPGVALEDQSREDLIWIREPFLSSRTSWGKIIVHGHTPQSEPEIRDNRINVDTGAFATGRLTSLVLEGRDRRFLWTGMPAA